MDDTAEASTHRSRNRVREVYDEIAPHFSQTRAYPWPEVEEFVADTREQLSDPRVGVDVGCGNGRHTRLLTRIVDLAIGVDLSRELLHEARDQSSDFALVQGDGTSLPLLDGCADVVLYVATVHHLPTREERVESLRELGRILASDGRGLVSAWSTEHDRFSARERDGSGFDTTIDWTLPAGETVPRFYHIYGLDEFRTDLLAADLVIENLELSSGNCYARVRSSDTGLG